MKFRTNGSDAMRLDSSGNVGIGTGAPTEKLHVSGTASVFKQQNNVTNWTLGLDAADQSYKIKHNGTERMRIDSDGHVIAPYGVTLGTAVGTYAAANTLDDYEEGTWTAGFSGATVTPTNTTGRYTKIGRVVYFSYYSGNSTIASASGQAQITGLPFTVEDDTQAYQPFYTSHNTFFGGSTSAGVEGHANKGNTNLIFITRGTTAKPSFVNGSGKFIMVAGFYLTTA
jgi:hypothetical protein